MSTFDYDHEYMSTMLISSDVKSEISLRKIFLHDNNIHELTQMTGLSASYIRQKIAIWSELDKLDHYVNQYTTITDTLNYANDLFKKWIFATDGKMEEIITYKDLGTGRYPKVQLHNALPQTFKVSDWLNMNTSTNDSLALQTPCYTRKFNNKVISPYAVVGLAKQRHIADPSEGMPRARELVSISYGQKSNMQKFRDDSRKYVEYASYNMKYRPSYS